MKDKQRQNAPQGQVEGEGSYSGTKDYNERTKRFIESGKVDEAARNAQPQSTEEARELREAERIGKSRAKEEDPELRD
jgi:hypothetical protein